MIFSTRERAVIKMLSHQRTGKKSARKNVKLLWSRDSRSTPGLPFSVVLLMHVLLCSIFQQFYQPPHKIQCTDLFSTLDHSNSPYLRFLRRPFSSNILAFFKSSARSCPLSGSSLFDEWSGIHC